MANVITIISHEEAQKMIAGGHASAILPRYDTSKPAERIIFYYHRGRLEPFVQTLKMARYTVELADSQRPLDSLGKSQSLHVIWGMHPHLVEDYWPIFQQLKALPNFWFCEQGWLPQAGNFYLDPTGTNGDSAIRGAARDVELTDSDRVALGKWLAPHARLTGDNGYIFCPLQVEDDANIKFWSFIPRDAGNRMLWFARQVCEQLPGQKIVFRTHPLERGKIDGLMTELLLKYPGARLDTSGDSLDWVAGARAVVGINSTVLTEALVYGKPVAMFGEGIMSDNGVCVECHGDPYRLRHVLTYRPDSEAIARFLHVLRQRQIPIDVQVEAFPKYPMLQKLLGATKPENCKPRIRELPKLETVEINGEPPVYGFIEYPDIPTDEIPARLTDSLKQPAVKGVVLNDCCLEDWECQTLRDNGVIPMYAEDLRWPHLRRLTLAKCPSGQIALGNSQTHEWHGTADEARAFIRFAHKHDFEWVCTLTQYDVCADLRDGGKIRDVLAEENILTIVLCGNVLIGYLYDLPEMPGMNDTSLTGLNLQQEFGLTAEALRGYCQGLRIFTGAGGARGLALGSRIYAQQLGFAGIICWCPFDLSGSLAVPVKTESRPMEICRGADVGIGDDFRKEGKP